MDDAIANILTNSSLTVDEKVEKTTELLSCQPDKGVSESIQFLLNTNDPAAATYPANYLSLLPNIRSEKSMVVEYILKNKNHLMIAAANLVKDISDEIIDQLIDEYFQNPSSSDMYSIINEVAQYFPERLRKFATEIDDEYIREALLPGAPDSWVDDLVSQYRQNEDPDILKSLAWIRTEKALNGLFTLARLVPKEQLGDIYAYIESSGVFPDTRLASIYFKNYRGYVVSRHESPHQMGGEFPHPVPKCPVTGIPANRILTLDVSQVDLSITSGYNPTFFWYEGTHPPDCIYVQFKPEGIKGLMTPMTDGVVGTDLIPGELALKLEEYPLKHGCGGSAVSGYSNHQVGGYPRLIRFERFPRCPICGKGMRFLVSIDSGMTPFGKLGFEGILYGFWCDECAVSCTCRQTDDY
ncbi:MAG TPA: hypothetical protein DEG17_02090 [Cyanobacteria bacterium UBA11149]|nr:hypothetical protein [Cyanobacteria bacterium UBA11367]HBE56598.1 hypothetical protein [Cyanobacteria bacterium UBA11366]HBK64077.1 hypothetical protein [Cyanobacteria bacterium UBA11166]HBR73827.1 hypothetical protein [Cyanobacteria bacterium UBA11159]HBS70056.1 hypothetical protein [Cyanobacteria bacterium UBA11153]HBW87699.1 hypothetical protein [Cyanobacteria bacterium UBA11149]HCA95366.1 hypothetical protein [Cyanobacteria bacterium UBA9226]